MHSLCPRHQGWTLSTSKIMLAKQELDYKSFWCFLGNGNHSVTPLGCLEMGELDDG